MVSERTRRPKMHTSVRPSFFSAFFYYLMASVLKNDSFDFAGAQTLRYSPGAYDVL